MKFVPITVADATSGATSWTFAPRRRSTIASSDTASKGRGTANRADNRSRQVAGIERHQSDRRGTEPQHLLVVDDADQQHPQIRDLVAVADLVDIVGHLVNVQRRRATRG